MVTLSLLVFSYILGSIPFGFLTGHLVKGIDIRNFGSGNIGATNVFRVLGKKWGVLVFILDFLKGLLPVLVVRSIGGFAPYVFVGVAVAVICGHNWTCFLRFKGGKGVATSVGVVLGLSFAFPALFIALFTAIITWVVFFYGLRYVSVASLACAFTFFLTAILLRLPAAIKVFAFVVFMLIVLRHKKNISNLLAKKENRF